MTEVSLGYFSVSHPCAKLQVVVVRNLRGEERRCREWGRQAAVCLDSIHDPSVCHCHSNSQRLQQDGKLHYHRNLFYVPLHLPSFLSPPHPHLSLSLSVCPPTYLCRALCLTSNPSVSPLPGSVSGFCNPLPLILGNISLYFSFCYLLSLHTHPYLCTG